MFPDTQHKGAVIVVRHVILPREIQENEAEFSRVLFKTKRSAIAEAEADVPRGQRARLKVDVKKAQGVLVVRVSIGW